MRPPTDHGPTLPDRVAADTAATRGLRVGARATLGVALAASLLSLAVGAVHANAGRDDDLRDWHLYATGLAASSSLAGLLCAAVAALVGRKRGLPLAPPALLVAAVVVLTLASVALFILTALARLAWA